MAEAKTCRCGAVLTNDIYGSLCEDCWVMVGPHSALLSELMPEHQYRINEKGQRERVLRKDRPHDTR